MVLTIQSHSPITIVPKKEWVNPFAPTEEEYQAYDARMARGEFHFATKKELAAEEKLLPLIMPNGKRHYFKGSGFSHSINKKKSKPGKVHKKITNGPLTFSSLLSSPSTSEARPSEQIVHGAQENSLKVENNIKAQMKSADLDKHAREEEISVREKNTTTANPKAANASTPSKELKQDKEARLQTRTHKQEETAEKRAGVQQGNKQKGKSLKKSKSKRSKSTKNKKTPIHTHETTKPLQTSSNKLQKKSSHSKHTESNAVTTLKGMISSFFESNQKTSSIPAQHAHLPGDISAEQKLALLTQRTMTATPSRNARSRFSSLTTSKPNKKNTVQEQKNLENVFTQDTAGMETAEKQKSLKTGNTFIPGALFTLDVKTALEAEKTTSFTPEEHYAYIQDEKKQQKQHGKGGKKTKPSKSSFINGAIHMIS